jgi:hypothetical protein
VGTGKGVELIAKRMNDVFMKVVVRRVAKKNFFFFFFFLGILCASRARSDVDAAECVVLKAIYRAS